MPKTLADRLAALEVLESAQLRQQVDAGVYIPEGVELRHVWPLFVWGVQCRHIYWRSNHGDGPLAIRCTPRHSFESIVEAAFAVAWPDAGITYDDVAIVAAVAWQAWQQDACLIPLFVHQVDELRDWLSTDAVPLVTPRDHAYQYPAFIEQGTWRIARAKTPDEKTYQDKRRMLGEVLHWLERRGRAVPDTPAALMAWLVSIRSELVELEGYEPETGTEAA